MADPGIDSIAVLQERTFSYFVREADTDTGLVLDSTMPDSPATIAGSGFACACYAVAAERGIISRSDAAVRVAHALRFLWSSEQSESPNASGLRGFFYHFLDPRTGRRTWDSEIS